ncbi:uncharacterized protein EV422DRAFT_505009 [Fimicolochytrium jonesii]|uniref:uncharacterized protein n=1 Tax=Fimicolochytrium jonesii TaxID=1396493 RepID=UPI0022FDD4C1|nr:uncharacterized protein EV422DRAFT_505009 [Fimicolochytrium jonesii]KAI8822950.1 hypothetical protein EV422DRAFT_505009 [Fimicolochytrium jonesii]
MSSIPPITTLRGAYIILRAARLAINRTQRTPRLAVCIAVDELVFMGTNGCEPTNEVRFVEEERKVFEALVRCAGWLEPLGSGTLHPPTKPRNDCHEPAPATFRRHVSAPITTTSHFHPYSRTHNPTLADFEEAQSLPPLPASALPSAEEPSESSQELTVSTRPETAGLGTQADTQVDGRMYVGEWDLLFLSDDENDGEDGEDDGKARDDATQKRRCAKCGSRPPQSKVKIAEVLEPQGTGDTLPDEIARRTSKPRLVEHVHGTSLSWELGGDCHRRGCTFGCRRGEPLTCCKVSTLASRSLGLVRDHDAAEICGTGESKRGSSQMRERGSDELHLARIEVVWDGDGGPAWEDIFSPSHWAEITLRQHHFLAIAMGQWGIRRKWGFRGTCSLIHWDFKAHSM